MTMREIVFEMPETNLHENGKLLAQVKNFRLALDKCLIVGGCGSLAGFPKGCCREATILLGRYLVNAGYEPLKVRYANLKHPPPTHMWIEYNDLIIDISADQFCGKKDEPAIVTSDQSWHSSSFPDPKSLPFSEFLQDFGENYRRKMAGLYEEISGYLSPPES